MDIIHNNRLLKRIPEKFSKIRNITDHLMDFEYIRLSKAERNILDKALFLQEAESFVMYLGLTEPLAFDHVKNASPVHTAQVLDPEGNIYPVLVMSNNRTVRCEETLYNLCPDKRPLLRSNEKQLSIF